MSTVIIDGVGFQIGQLRADDEVMRGLRLLQRSGGRGVEIFAEAPLEGDCATCSREVAGGIEFVCGSEAGLKEDAGVTCFAAHRSLS